MSTETPSVDWIASKKPENVLSAKRIAEQTNRELKLVGELPRQDMRVYRDQVTGAEAVISTKLRLQHGLPTAFELTLLLQTSE